MKNIRLILFMVVFFFLLSSKVCALEDGVYTIHSSINNNYVLDINGGVAKNGSNVQLYTSNGTNAQKFKVKRINKTVSEVKAEMEQPDYVSFVEGELFYQKPSFAIALGAAIGGLIAVAVIVTLIKRFAVNAYDSDEPEFYSPVE